MLSPPLIDDAVTTLSLYMFPATIRHDGLNRTSCRPHSWPYSQPQRPRSETRGDGECKIEKKRLHGCVAGPPGLYRALRVRHCRACLNPELSEGNLEICRGRCVSFEVRDQRRWAGLRASQRFRRTTCLGTSAADQRAPLSTTAGSAHHSGKVWEFIVAMAIFLHRLAGQPAPAGSHSRTSAVVSAPQTVKQLGDCISSSCHPSLCMHRWNQLSAVTKDVRACVF